VRRTVEGRLAGFRGRRLGALACAALSAAAIAITAGASLPATAGARAKRQPARCIVPGYTKTLDQLWRPAMGVAIRYAQSRGGDVAFAVRTEHHFYGYRADHVEWSASVLKAMLMVAFLDMPSVAHRPLTGAEAGLLIPMITQSSNSAADAMIGIVGLSRLRALAARVGMTRFEPVLPIWGESHITASDQTKFFYRIDKFITPLHRTFGMHLLASVTPSQRWGIGEVTPRGWVAYFKGGWGSGTGLIDHQVVLLKRRCARVSLAVLTMNDGSHAYGKETLRGVFARLLRGFPLAPPHRKHQRAHT
jgi:Beta-lactamase enzyme family